MGNKLCKKRVDHVDSSSPKPKTPTPFNRIINKFSLKPKWKSADNLEEKQVQSYDVNAMNEKNENPGRPPRPLSRSTTWTEVELEVPEKKNESIFNENSTPIPPPRKHKKGIREKLESVAKSSLQAFQNKKPVEEPLCVKKIINYTCPCGDPNHKKNHKHEDVNKDVAGLKEQARKRKTPSVASLPNYNEFKLSIAGETNVDSDRHSSAQSLPDDSKKSSTKSSADKLDNYLTRARSFGSLLPQMLLHKLSTAKAPLAEIESDDSLNGLDDWGLNMIEHYKPKDSSLPRPRRNDVDNLADLESMIVSADDETTPIAPTRRSESLLKRINREGNESAKQRTNGHLEGSIERSLSVTPPPSPDERDSRKPRIPADQLPLIENGVVEHSNLMKILEECSERNQNNNNNTTTISTQPINDFLNAERADYNFNKISQQNAIVT